jgi:hypothetical protein
MSETKSVFEKYVPLAWPHRYAGTLHVSHLCGGIPTDPHVAAGWIRTKMGATSDEVLQARVGEVMAERGIAREEATEAVALDRHLNGFKRQRCDQCPPGALCEGPHQLYIEGRQLKAAIKEAAMIAVATDKLPSGRWGKTSKGLKAFLAEHVGVVEDRLMLGRTEPSGVAQRFVQTFRGTGIQYEEFVSDVDLDFTVITDYEFTEQQWGMIFLTGQEQGIGATRSQGYGKYAVTRWDKLDD